MQSDSIAFPEGHTGSTLLNAALTDAVQAFPDVFAGLEIPPPGRAFRKTFAEVLGSFEARRAASPQRVPVARRLAGFLAQRATLGDRPLTERIGEGTAEDPVVVRGTAPPGWTPAVRWRGETFEGAAIGQLAVRMREACQITEAAARALGWMAEHLLQEPVVLTEHRFALLGAAAELAPTPFLLEAGARVLWVDRQPPALSADHFAGTLVAVPDAQDLLTQAPAIRAAVAREASPVHLGLYAYAPGRGRELLLTAAMNAIAAATEPTSVSLLVSPTTPGEVHASCREDRATRQRRLTGWQRALASVGALGGPSFHEDGGVEIARSIVALQGPTYQAAQYLGKMMLAEAWAADRAHTRISANVAGITRTRSLEHPLFLAGFLGAPSFGIQIYDPEQTRVLMALLMLHDLFAPDAPSTRPLPDRARDVVAQSVHGGVRSSPFALDPTIRVAAVLGLTRRPSLLARLLSGR